MNTEFTRKTPRAAFAMFAVIATLLVGGFIEGLSDYTVGQATQTAQTTTVAKA